MAERPVFVSSSETPYVQTINTEFKFYPGLAITQAHKSVQSLQESFLSQHSEYQGLILEISSKSKEPLGVLLSAFNLQYSFPDRRKYSVEQVFQAGKCFANGKQYLEILDMTSMGAKKYEPLHTSGEIVKFRLNEMDFPTKPLTFFYDWLYIHALAQNKGLADQVTKYRAFTDIAFNPAKSINCQARSAALFVSLHENDKLKEALSSPDRFLKIVYDDNCNKREKKKEKVEQLSLF